MRKLLPIIGLVLALCGLGVAQTPDKSGCPTISVSGPMGIVKPGDIVTYTVRVDTKGEQFYLEYIWSVSAGKIVSGQGTTVLEVRMPAQNNLTVTIGVKGFPDGCPNIFSETDIWDPPPEALKLDEFIGPLAKIANERFAKIVNAVHSQPDVQLYVIISGTQRNPSLSIRRKRDIIANRIVPKFGDDRTRVTFVDSGKNNDRVVFWLVPPGANPPKIDNK